AGNVDRDRGRVAVAVGDGRDTAGRVVVQRANHLAAAACREQAVLGVVRERLRGSVGILNARQVTGRRVAVLDRAGGGFDLGDAVLRVANERYSEPGRRGRKCRESAHAGSGRRLDAVVAEHELVAVAVLDAEQAAAPVDAV